MPPKQIHLIRHAEGFHNLCVDYAIRDPLLTPEGEQQCIRLRGSFKDIQSVDCIIASPLRRALYTALIVFQDILKEKPDLRIIALPELQETGSIPTDVGLPCKELELEFRNHPIDFSLVSEDWNNKTTGPNVPRTDLNDKRAGVARRFLWGRNENEVAAVTHGGFAHFLTQDWEDSLGGDGTGWANGELRTYDLNATSLDGTGNVAMTETTASRARRKHDARLLTPDEQAQVRTTALRSWAAAGYIILADDAIE